MPIGVVIVVIVLILIVIILGFRLGWWRALKGLVLYSAGRIPHPALTGSQTVRFDTQAIHDSAVAGEAFALSLGHRHVDLVVTAAPVGPPDVSAVELNDEGQSNPDLGQVVTFSGAVRGEEDSDVRLTVTPQTITGYIRTKDGWFFIDPLRRFKPQADATEYVVYRTKDLHFKVPFGDDAPAGSFEPVEGDGPAHSVNPHVGIAIWGDEEYQAQAADTGLTWWQAQATLVNMVNGIFQSQVGVEFVVRVFVLDLRGSTLTTNDASDLLDQFGGVVMALHGDIRRLSVRQSTGIEVAHLVTGRNLQGRTLGIAWRPGVWGLAQQTLVIRVFGMVFPTVTAYGNLMVSAHELGHNFAGDHDEAEKICVTHFLWCWDYERTLMWPTYYSDNRDEFSADNDTIVTNNAQSGRNVNFTHP